MRLQFQPLRSLVVSFFNDTATTEIYTLSLHDALPIFHAGQHAIHRAESLARKIQRGVDGGEQGFGGAVGGGGDLGEDLTRFPFGPGDGDGDYRGRGVEGKDQHLRRRSAAGPTTLTRRVVGVWWAMRTTVGFSMRPSAGSAHSTKVTAPGSR